MNFSDVHLSGAASDFPRKARAETRIATSSTMIAMLLLLFGSATSTHAPRFAPGQPQEQSKTVGDERARAVRIVDPAFCDNQTWPYIDARCLKRVEPASISEEQNSSGSNAPTPAPSKVVAAEAMPNDRQDGLPLSSGQSSNGLSAASLPEGVPAALSSDTRAAAQQATDQALAVPTGEHLASFWGRSAATDEIAPVSDVRHRDSRHRHRRYGVFGFRF